MQSSTLCILAVIVCLHTATGVDIDPRRCRQQETCGQCQSVSPECSWCADERYSWDRCDRSDYQQGSRCGNVVNHQSTQTVKRARAFSRSVAITPQWVAIELYKGRSSSLTVRVKAIAADVNRGRIVLRTRVTAGLQLETTSTCLGFQGSTTTKICPRITAGQTVEFTLKVKLAACSGSGKKRIRVLSPGIRGRSVRIDVAPKCQCDCEVQSSGDDSRCNENGRFSCGVCQCYRGWSGEGCECQSGGGDASAQCLATPNATRECSGRGRCVCGNCVCYSDSSARHRYYGRYCECNDYVCPFHDGQLCGGSDRGRCVCGSCMCINGYRGEACSLSTDTSSCMARNGQLCGGNGLCLGGVCRCEGLFSGATCENCPTCMGRCHEFKNCVLCFAFNTGPLDLVQCNTQCSSLNIELVDAVNPFEPGATACSLVDDGDGSFFFFNYRSTDELIIKIQRTKVFAGR